MLIFELISMTDFNELVTIDLIKKAGLQLLNLVNLHLTNVLTCIFS